MKCRICGTENPPQAKYCAVCGSQLEEEKKPEQTQEYNNQYNNQYNAQYGQPQYNYQNNNIYANNGPKNNYAKISLITGIIAIATTIVCCLFIAGLPFGIVSIVFGALACKKDKENMGKAIVGIVLSAIAIFINIIFFIELIIIFSDPELMEQIRQAYEDALNGEYGFRFLIKYLLKMPF